MAANHGKDSTLPTLPPLRIDQSEKPEIVISRSEKNEKGEKNEKISHIPIPSRATNVACCGLAQAPKSLAPTSRPKHHVPHRFLTPAEWARIAHGIGAIKEGETHTVVHPTSWYWPPKGLPDGLYREVVFQRTKNFYSYHILSVVRWFLMIFQIVLGACLTALGSMGYNYTTAVTTLAAINTIDAGVLALMHNSGLPDRYRMNKVEFAHVEDHIKALLDTGIVESHQTVDEIIAECYHRFRAAKATVLANMPDYYANAALAATNEKPGLPPIEQPGPGHPGSGHPGPAVPEKSGTPALNVTHTAPTHPQAPVPPPRQDHGPSPAPPVASSAESGSVSTPSPAPGHAATSTGPFHVMSRHMGR